MGTDMLLTEAKVQKRVDELFGYRYRDIRDIKSYQVMEDVSGISNPTLPEWREEENHLLSRGETWKGRDRYLWMQTKLVIPEEWNTRKPGTVPVGKFDFGITGPGYSSGYESMLYIDGEPYQSLDTNHREVFFREEQIGRELRFTVRLWSGLEGGGKPREMTHRINDSFIALLDLATDELFWNGYVILRAIRELREEQPERNMLLRALDKAFYMIDWTDKGSDMFYETVKMANEELQKSIAAMEKHELVTINCVGHTHIDTAWLWRLKHTREKVARSFSTVLRLMERYSEYLFFHSQPQQYVYIKEDYPQLYEQIKERIKEGRWEIDGGMWVEADCNLPSGESLTRQFLLGRRFMLEEFGKEPEFLWLPDVFGYSAALPQIMKKSGIHTFMTTKISWNQYNRMPNDTFWWEGLDGSKVLAHFITTPSMNQNLSKNFRTCYGGNILPDNVIGAWKQYREKDLTQDVLLAYGWGDGGGGVTRGMLDCRRIIDKLPGMPNVKTTTAGEFFRRLQETVAHTERPMATWDGEMYLELHRGTFTSQAYVKKMNRYLENLYRKAEWLTAMNAVKCGELSHAKQETLTEGWKIILTHQFHDIIPGSSIHEVYDDAKMHYQSAKEIADKVIEDSYISMLDQTKTETYSILNVAAHSRSGMVRIWDNLADSSGKSLYDEDENELRIQEGYDGVWVHVNDVPAMGVKNIYVKDKNIRHNCEMESVHEKNMCASIDENDGRMDITTSFYHLRINEVGQIVSFYDIENTCQVLQEGTCANVFQMFEDKPLDNDAWDIDMFYYEKMQEVTNLMSRRILENGPIRTVIRQEWNMSKSSICQDMILYSDNRRIDFKTKVNWQETQKLLKVAFPVDIRSTYATYDIQYGNIKRPNHSNTSWERAKFEVVGHRWADLSQHGYGVSLLNDCKYGYDIHQNILRLTLLKAAIFPDYAEDKGEHDFTYAIYPHRDDFVDGGTVQEAFDLNQPLEAISGTIRLPVKEGKGTIQFAGAAVELDACKKSEDGKYLVLRFHEYAGARGDVEVHFAFPVRSVCQCDLMECPTEEFYPIHENKLQTTVRPYEIKTFLIRI